MVLFMVLDIWEYDFRNILSSTVPLGTNMLECALSTQSNAMCTISYHCVLFTLTIYSIRPSAVLVTHMGLVTCNQA